MSYPFGDMGHIIDLVGADNKILLIQLLYHYADGVLRIPRVFRFQRLGMMRDIKDSGEVFEPATVKSSFAITCASTFAHLFAIDLTTREVIWLNIAHDSHQRIAGETSMAFLMDYLRTTSVFNLYDFARMLATEVVDDPAEADVVFGDNDEPLHEGAEHIRRLDTERIIELLN